MLALPLQLSFQNAGTEQAEATTGRGGCLRHDAFCDITRAHPLPVAASHSHLCWCFNPSWESAGSPYTQPMTTVSAQAMKSSVIPLAPYVSISWKRTIPPWKERERVQLSRRRDLILCTQSFPFFPLTSLMRGSPRRKQLVAMARTSSSLARGLRSCRGNRSLMDVARLSTQTNWKNTGSNKLLVTDTQRGDREKRTLLPCVTGNITWVSRPRKSTMRKKRTAQKLEAGSLDRALGNAMNARPGPAQKQNNT